MPEAFQVPAKGAVEYQYSVIPTGFKQDRWVTAAEARPGVRSVVHHAVVYIREPGSTWTRGPTKADILTIYSPGSAPDISPPGMAKLVKAGSDLVIETHYTPTGKAVADRTQVAVTFAKSARKIVRVHAHSRRRTAGNSAEGRPLRFLLAAFLPAGAAAAPEEGRAAGMDRNVR
jgi:hypothetical protein